MSAPPIPMAWDGEHFTPAGRYWAKKADEHFVVGKTYPLEVREERSHKSHAHFFAALAEAHANLPEDLAERFPTVEALRKYALIRAGFRNERSIACASKDEARRLAAFIKPMDPYAVIVARDDVVIVYTARSQSARAMDKATFQESKDKVLDVVAALIGTTKDALQKAQAA